MSACAVEAIRTHNIPALNMSNRMAGVPVRMSLPTRRRRFSKILIGKFPPLPDGRVAEFAVLRLFFCGLVARVTLAGRIRLDPAAGHAIIAHVGSRAEPAVGRRVVRPAPSTGPRAHGGAAGCPHT